MECLHPRLDKVGHIYPCGRCPFCRDVIRQDIANRVMLESSVSRSSFFITLTYADEHLPRLPGTSFNCFNKSHVQKFCKAIQDYIRPKKRMFRYILVSEYGDNTYRSHYHACIFFNYKYTLAEVQELLEKFWPYGFVTIGFITPARAMYIAKYTLKEDSVTFKEDIDLPFDTDPWQPFTLYSRRPGIGYSPRCVAYCKDKLLYQLSSAHFLDYSFIDKVPRGIRNRFNVFLQEFCRRSGNEKLKLMADGLRNRLKDDVLNKMVDYDDVFRGTRLCIPNLEVDRKIIESRIKIRKSKKNSL